MHSGNAWAAWVAVSNDALAAALPDGLGLRDVEALTLVREHPGESVEWLRARIGLTQSGTVRLVDRLEGLGLVQRARAGGRGLALSLTGSGRRVLRSWDAARDRALDGLLDGVPAADRARLLELLGTALRSRPRSRPEADRACRTCQWALCEPECPVDRSVDR
jgi:DNA-binding MarR family transcriptional regulator